jgi:hypothetical protein
MEEVVTVVGTTEAEGLMAEVDLEGVVATKLVLEVLMEDMQVDEPMVVDAVDVEPMPERSAPHAV